MRAWLMLRSTHVASKKRLYLGSRRRLWTAATSNDVPENPQNERTQEQVNRIGVDDRRPTSSSDAAQATRSRHLLRAILRECTYLPDSFARQWTSKHALSRFRTYSFKAWKTRSDDDFQLRRRAKEKEARQAVAFLRRANAGERKCVIRVLFMAYGRIGKRRHELMMPLLPTKGREEIEKFIVTQNAESAGARAAVEDAQAGNGTKDPASVDRILEGGTQIPTAADSKQSTLPELTQPLRALLQSQMASSPPEWTRPNPRRLKPDIPELNSWLRPMPQRRVKNMRKKHYASLLDRVLPPLPTEQWRRLRDLASGKAAPDSAIPRRKPARTSGEGSEVATKPKSALEMTVQYGKVPTKFVKDWSGHAITPRFMQRVYAQVFGQCPLMDWDANSKDWKITWGEQALYRPHADLAPVKDGIEDLASTSECPLNDEEAAAD